MATAAAGGTVAALAPVSSRAWVAWGLGGAWLCLAGTAIVSHLVVRRLRGAADRAAEEARTLRQQLDGRSAEGSHLVHVALPGVVRQLHDGAEADDVLAGMPQPSDPSHRQLLQLFTTTVAQAERRTAAATAAQHRTAAEHARFTDELKRLVTETLPPAVQDLREGASADRVLAGLELPQDDLLRGLAEEGVRELARSERRAAAAQAASAKALARVQAKSVSMLADLRDMQDRHGEDVLGDLLTLDHSTSQLGLMTDRLALLMGGRASRAWNKPIVMESILRGAVGRISAYQRVRLHCATKSAVVGFAAEGVMHLLAELMDNAANFSPPIDEVHVYVEEASAGMVVTIEDSGLKMAEAAMRRARESVSGQATDLAALQGTRLGLAVVGRLAVKYGINVSFRPSSRGGTGVVVLIPPQLVTQRAEAVRQPVAPIAPAARPAIAPDPLSAAEPSYRPEAPEAPLAPGAAARPDSARPSTPGGLPVRRPGRTMADAHARHPELRDAADSRTGTDGSRASAPRPPRDAGARFGAFHQARRATREPDGNQPDSNEPGGPDAAP
ncbi:ATP-binding protein [Streptomyces sp. NPDC000410]|uniref:sensor histidine kinase n=1 Tax=Streptomyces sp. NPDC000410 TaxID=3154254 RepID=UPI0033265D59